LGYLVGGEGQESIGSAVYLTGHDRVRTLSRSKALKSQALACRRLLLPAFREPNAPFRAFCVDPPSAVLTARSFTNSLRRGGVRVDVKSKVGVARTNVSDVAWQAGSRGGAFTGRGESPPQACLWEALASQNDKRASGVERRHGWLRGKSSEGRNQTLRADVA
jgi:hypothetical protein